LSRPEISREEELRKKTALGLGLPEDTPQGEIDELYDWYEGLSDKDREEVNEGKKTWFEEYQERTGRGKGVEVKGKDQEGIFSEDAKVIRDAGLDPKTFEERGGWVRIESLIKDGKPAIFEKKNMDVFLGALRKSQDKKELADLRESVEESYRDGEKEKGSEDQEEERQQLERLKLDLYDLAEAVKRLRVEFLKRDNDRLNPLIDSGDIGALSSAALGLENAADNIKVNEDDLSLAISRTARLLDGIGKIGQSGGVVEDEGSLEVVGHLLQMIEDQCGVIVSRTPGAIGKYDTSSFKSSISRLFDSAQGRRLVVGNKLQRLRDYHDLRM